MALSLITEGGPRTGDFGYLTKRSRLSRRSMLAPPFLRRFCLCVGAAGGAPVTVRHSGTPRHAEGINITQIGYHVWGAAGTITAGREGERGLGSYIARQTVLHRADARLAQLDEPGGASRHGFSTSSAIVRRTLKSGFVTPRGQMSPLAADRPDPVQPAVRSRFDVSSDGRHKNY